MITLLDHVDRLSKHTKDTKDEILQSILLNNFIIDDDTLFCYFIDHTPWEDSITLTWIDGDSNKIKEWIKKVMKENGCTKMYGITTRWKAFAKKYGARPVGMLMERGEF